MRVLWAVLIAAAMPVGAWLRVQIDRARDRWRAIRPGFPADHHNREQR